MKAGRLCALLLLAGTAFSGCSNIHSHPGGKLYVTVTNATGSSILRFDNAFTVNGNVAPGASISGSSTTLNQPEEVALDTANNRLYVANNGGASVVVYDGVSTQNGNVAPSRTLAGAATTLAAPTAVALDKGRDLLYVADSGNVLVFSPASTASGNVAPVRTLALGFTAFAVFDDAANDRLYVADGAGNAIDAYDSASTLNGAVAASRIVSGAATLLATPSGLVLDASGRLLVCNGSGASITIYNNAASASGNVAPSATISGGSTTLLAPQQAALDASGGNLYVGDGGAGEVAVFDNISSVNGNVAPNRNLTGSSTGLGPAGILSVRGVALDVTR